VRRGFPTGAAPVQTATAVHAQLALPIRSSAGDPGKVPLSTWELPCFLVSGRRIPLSKSTRTTTEVFLLSRSPTSTSPTPSPLTDWPDKVTTDNQLSAKSEATSLPCARKSKPTTRRLTAAHPQSDPPSRLSTPVPVPAGHPRSSCAARCPAHVCSRPPLPCPSPRSASRPLLAIPSREPRPPPPTNHPPTRKARPSGGRGGAE
jgi:hypothetical protein